MDFSDENPKCSGSLWNSILGSIIGGFVVYLLLKDRLQAQLPVGIGGQQYQNAESWQLQRGDDGRISNLTVSRDAHIGNGYNKENRDDKSVVYKPLSYDNRGCEITYSDYPESINKTINVDLLTETVNQRLEKRWAQLNKKENDLMRRQRFGFQ